MKHTKQFEEKERAKIIMIFDLLSTIVSQWEEEIKIIEKGLQDVKELFVKKGE